MALIAFAALCGCSHQTARSRGEPEVILRAAGGEEQHVKVELARTESERARGLMYRQRLEAGRGMLFLFERPQKLTFWMKNTYIPLDLVFIDPHLRVIFVEENAEPLTLSARGPDEDAQFVLEVPGGWTRAHGIGPGSQVRFLAVD